IGNCSTPSGNCEDVLIATTPNQISITGLSAPIEIVQVFDENYVPIFRCEGGECGTEQIINDLSAGDYIVGVQFYTANWAFICERTNVKVTVTGTINPPPPTGSADCNALTFTPEAGQISVAGLNTAYSQVQIIGQNTDWQVVTICSGDCQATQIIPNLASGEYAVKVQLNASDGTDCYREEKVTVGGTPPPPPPPTNGNCEDLNVFVANSELMIQGLTAPIEIVQVFDENYQLVFRCQGADCGAEQTINNLAAGNYFVSVQFYTADWKFICAKENMLVTIEDGNTDIFCEEAEKDGFTRLGNVFAKEFYVSNNSLPIEEAKQACSNANTRLATSLTNEEMDFIRANIDNEVFIDLSDANQEGTFQWANDRTYNTPIFDNTETNDLVFIAAWNDQLIATNNSVWKHFVCEMPCAVSGNSNDSRNAAIPQLENAIKLFPNPAQSIINLQVLPLLDKKGTIQIFNVYGQLVQQFDQLHFKEAHQQLEIPNFENGLYWLTIQAENMPLISKRFVVEHWK
ncbi:MAG: T9SS type A sorting domain-containing protein, partial [Saprospiraceae bacterium]